MFRGVFVTGTDTGVGKTVVSAALMHRYRRPGADPRHCYWKPIQTAVGRDDDTAQVRRLGRCPNGEVLSEGIRLRRPLSPHLAARLSGERIELTPLLETIGARPMSTRWIVEGAGGVLVPVNDSELMVDLICRLALPAVIVSRAKLGTINHTLLTIEALRARSLSVAGVVMVGSRNRENRAAIEDYGRVSVLGELPRLNPLTPGTLGRWACSELDRDGLLMEFLG